MNRLLCFLTSKLNLKGKSESYISSARMGISKFMIIIPTQIFFILNNLNAEVEVY